MHLAWRFHNTNQEMLWANILKAKYGHRLSLPSCSFSWKSITLGWQLCKPGLQCLIGNGNSVLFWHDTWCADFSLRSLIHGPFLENEDIKLVNTYIFENKFNLGFLPFQFPNTITNKIHSLYLPQTPSLDSFFWSKTSNSSLYSKSAYTFLLQESYPPELLHLSNFNWLWIHLQTLPNFPLALLSRKNPL